MGMALSVHLPQAIFGDGGIDLGGRKAAVAEHFLDRANVGAGVQKVSGEAVPQAMGAETAPQPAHPSQFRQYVAGASIGKRMPLSVQEQAWAPGFKCRPQFEIVPEGCPGVLSQKNDAIFTSFTGDLELFGYTRLDQFDVQAQKFADSHTG